MAKKKSVSEEIKEEVNISEEVKEEPVIDVVEEIKEEVKEEPKEKVVERVFDSPIVEKGKSNVEMANVRAKASIDSPIVSMVAKNTEVIIDPERSTNEFYKVNALGVQGYIRKDLIDIIK